jgi:hypothetical protein
MGLTSCRWITIAKTLARPATHCASGIMSDLRYNWARVWLAAIDQTETRELVVDAWRMVVPKRVAAEYLSDSR